MITTVLVANRGEIARRIIRGCRAAGLRSIALYSDLDRTAAHVREADDAVRIESYLDIDEVVAAARTAGADAVHPGYGFLSERAAFARAVEEAGLVLVGPTAEVMDRMGRKDAAREIAVEAGVPVVPSYDVQADPESFAFPVLVKAAAGGGGKGMRIVRDAGEYAAALASAKREATSAFGDDTILIEKYVEHGRHIEVQVLADHHGNVVHLFERDCSTQRRHQKVLEEAPGTDHLRGRTPHGHRGVRRAGRARGLPQRRHRRVPARRRHRRGLLPRDEHPAPGRAPGHRGRGRLHQPAGAGHRRDRPGDRPGPPPAAGRRRRTAAVRPARPHPARPRDRGAGLRRGPVPRVPAPGRHRHPGALARARPRRRGARERPGRQHVVRPDARQDHRARPGPRVRPPGAGRRPRRDRDPRADHQHRLPAGAGGQRRVPGRDDRHRLARPAHRRRAGPRAAPGVRGLGPGDAGRRARPRAPVPGRRLARRCRPGADPGRARRDRRRRPGPRPGRGPRRAPARGRAARGRAAGRRSPRAGRRQRPAAHRRGRAPRPPARVRPARRVRRPRPARRRRCDHRADARHRPRRQRRARPAGEPPARCSA